MPAPKREVKEWGGEKKLWTDGETEAPGKAFPPSQKKSLTASPSLFLL